MYNITFDDTLTSFDSKQHVIFPIYICGHWLDLVKTRLTRYAIYLTHSFVLHLCTLYFNISVCLSNISIFFSLVRNNIRLAIVDLLAIDAETIMAIVTSVTDASINSLMENDSWN